ncbi:MAG: hypothetical protein J6T80_05390 [Paludibacteraceae bacterium]|nr:hypothetical protein [Paludibacteraceae bacterium]
MHTSEWPREFSEYQYVVVDGYTVKVFSSRGQSYNLISDASIVDAMWAGGAVIVSFRNGRRVRFYGPYGNQYEDM